MLELRRQPFTARPLHLRVVATDAEARSSRRDPARLAVFGLGIASTLLVAASFFLPWWRFWLYAPQYPKGLELVISLTGMSGDVHEIDLLNHYIGMKHLEDAAPLERRLAVWGVAAIAIATVTALTAAGKRWNTLAAAPAVSFPLVFLADSFCWLYAFGHDLDRHAPLRIGAFTPQMFGNGKIGQFETFAQPSLGFWLAVAGAVCAIAAALLRSGVCARCDRAAACGHVCPRTILSPKETS